MKSLQHEKLPSADDKKAVAKEVQALYHKYLPTMLAQKTIADRDWAAYSDRNPSARNIIFSNVEAAIPVIERSLALPTIFSRANPDLGLELEKLVSAALAESGLLEEHGQVLVKTLIVEGTIFLKVFYNAEQKGLSVARIAAERLLWGPIDVPFEDAIFYIDCVKTTPGEILRLFDVDIEKKLGSYSQEETTTEPTYQSSSVSLPIDAPVGTEGYAQMTIDETDRFFSSSEKESNANPIGSYTKLECYFKDITRQADGTPLYPTGRLVIVVLSPTNKAFCLSDTPNPLPIMPFEQVCCHIIKGKPYGMSEVSQQIGVQSRLNETVKMTQDNMEVCANRAYLYDSAVFESSAKIEKRAGGLIGVDMANRQGPLSNVIVPFPTEFLAGHTLPFINHYLQEAEAVSGVTDVSTGRILRGDPSGVAIARLQDKSDTRFIYIARNINHGVKRVYKKMALSYVALFAPELWLETGTMSVIAARKARADDVLVVLQSALQLDQALPGAGEMFLSRLEDKGIMQEYKEKREAVLKQMQEAQAAQAEAEGQRAQGAENATKMLALAKIRANQKGAPDRR